MPGADDAVDGPAEAEYRPVLFSIAYGMTGSAGDAEDIVQDAFLGLTRARKAGTTITDPKAYLATAVMRLGINYQKSARVRRETYVGDWLPEPIVVPVDGTGPAEHAALPRVPANPRVRDGELQGIHPVWADPAPGFVRTLGRHGRGSPGTGVPPGVLPAPAAR